MICHGFINVKKQRARCSVGIWLVELSSEADSKSALYLSMEQKYRRNPYFIMHGLSPAISRGYGLVHNIGTTR